MNYGKCEYDDLGMHQLTVDGNPRSKMTYHRCLLCGKSWERGQGSFYGQEKPQDNSLAGRLNRIEKKG